MDDLTKARIKWAAAYVALVAVVASAVCLTVGWGLGRTIPLGMIAAVLVLGWLDAEGILERPRYWWPGHARSHE